MGFAASEFLSFFSVLGIFPEPLFGALAVLDIGTRSVPLGNLSMLVT
jgi:hypothetical protein